MRTAVDIPRVRSVLHEDIAALPQDQIEGLVRPLLEQLPARDRVTFNQVAQRTGQVAPGAVAAGASGAATGAAFGPYGALVGGLLGAGLSVAQQLSQPAPRTPRPQAPPTRPQAPPPTAPPAAIRSAAAPPAAPRSPAPSTALSGQPSPNTAAAQLLTATASQPMLQAILALILGQLGRRSIAVGDTQASPAALLNLLSVLAGRAAAEAIASEGADGYLYGASGEALCDIYDREARADVLMSRLVEAANAAPPPVPVELDDDVFEDDAFDDDLFGEDLDEWGLDGGMEVELEIDDLLPGEVIW